MTPAETVAAARRTAEEAGIPLDRYDSGLSVIEAEALLGTGERSFLSVGDYVLFSRPNGKKAMWKVQSVLLGAEGQESVYGISVADLDAPHDLYGLRITEMYVPCVLLEAVAMRGTVVKA